MLLRFLVAVTFVFATSMSLSAQIDLSNVIAGDVIDNTTVIPDGSVINLNGGTIASGTQFSAAAFPNGVTLNINDGIVGLGVEINNSTINIAGGQVALSATDLSEGVNNINNDVTVTGGDVGSFFQLRGDSTLQLSGGSVEGFGTLLDASATITGGSFNLADNNGTLDIFGGDFTTFRVFPTSAVVNLHGTDFAIDGVPITGLQLNSPFEVNDRNVTLTGTLSDGSTFSNLLDSLTPQGNLNFDPEFGEFIPGFASAGSTVNVILTPPSVPEPNTVVMIALAGCGMLSQRRRR